MPWVIAQICAARISAFLSGAWKDRSTSTVARTCPSKAARVFARVAWPAGVAEHGAVEPRFGAREGKVSLTAPAQRRDGVRLAAVPGASEQRVEMAESVLRQRGDQRVAIGEMAVGRGAGDADALGRLGQGEAGEAAFRNQRARGGEQRLAQASMMV